jgi:hypothetical protein
MFVCEFLLHTFYSCSSNLDILGDILQTRNHIPCLFAQYENGHLSELLN